MNSRSFSIGYVRRPKSVSMGAWCLLRLIADHHSDRDHCAFCHKSYAAEMLNIDASYVQDLIWELEDKGLLKVYERTGKGNRYVIPPLPGEIVSEQCVIWTDPTLPHPDFPDKIWRLREHPRRDGSADAEDRAWRAERRKRDKAIADFMAQVPARSHGKRRTSK